MTAVTLFLQLSYSRLGAQHTENTVAYTVPPSRRPTLCTFVVLLASPLHTRQLAGPTPPTRRPLIRFGVVSSDRMHKTVMVSAAAGIWKMVYCTVVLCEMRSLGESREPGTTVYRKIFCDGLFYICRWTQKP